MAQILRFEAAGNTYTFDFVQAFSDNFKDVVPRTRRLPGADGGFDTFGLQKAPSEVGAVNVQWGLSSDTREGMDALRDAANAMLNWGKGRLFKQPSEPTDSERYCYARVNNLQISEQPAQQTELKQLVQATFQVSDPYWYNADASATWGHFNWASADWGQATPIAGSGRLTASTLTNNGNATSPAHIGVVIPSAQSAGAVEVRRLIDGTLRDSVKYNAALAAGDSLVIDARQKKVLKNSADAFDANFAALNSHWFRLEPGVNDIEIILLNAGDQADVSITFMERYY